MDLEEIIGLPRLLFHPQVIKMLLRSVASSPELLQKTLTLFRLGVPAITHR